MPVPPRRVLPDAPTSDVATASPAVPRRAWLLRGVRARPGPRIAADTASALRASWAAGCPRAVQLRIRGQCSGLPLRAAPDEAWVRQALRVDAPRVAGSPGSRHAARDDLLRDMQRQLTPRTVIGLGFAEPAPAFPAPGFFIRASDHATAAPSFTSQLLAAS